MKRTIAEDHTRISSGLRRMARRAERYGDIFLRHAMLKMLLQYQLLTFNRKD